MCSHVIRKKIKLHFLYFQLT